MRHRLQAEQWLPFPIEDVFRFFSNPDNLPKLMPRWQHARLEKMQLVPPPQHDPDKAAGLAGAGSRILLSFRPFPLCPVRLRWEAQIAEFAWNQHFSDLQLKGPFANWLHRHSVQPSASNGPTGPGILGTLLHDEVTYEVPLGALGRVANKLFVRHQLRRMFAYRQARTLELLSADKHSR
jgi:ligand-binding SRPBCC domain-containing protein